MRAWLNGLTYSTKAEVKSILDIDATDTTYDTELDARITSADGLFDSILPVEVKLR